MKIAKVSFEESIDDAVIKTGKCVGCGTCVLVCPFGCLEYAAEKSSSRRVYALSCFTAVF